MKGGGAVAEWSKALLLKEKINKSQKDHRFNPQPGQSLMNFLTGHYLLNIEKFQVYTVNVEMSVGKVSKQKGKETLTARPPKP